VDVTGIEPVTPCLQISVAVSQLFGISNLRSVRLPLFGAIRTILEHFRYDLCANTWRQFCICDSYNDSFEISWDCGILSARRTSQGMLAVAHGVAFSC
jgi:hypothetical protein